MSTKPSDSKRVISTVFISAMMILASALSAQPQIDRRAMARLEAFKHVLVMFSSSDSPEFQRRHQQAFSTHIGLADQDLRVISTAAMQCRTRLMDLTAQEKSQTGTGTKPRTDPAAFAAKRDQEVLKFGESLSQLLSPSGSAKITRYVDEVVAASSGALGPR